MKPERSVLRSRAAPGIIRQPGKRKDRQILFSYDVNVEPRTPELRQRRVLPMVRMASLDPRMNRKQRSPRHGIL
jgi:hypothetical protein